MAKKVVTVEIRLCDQPVSFPFVLHTIVSGEYVKQAAFHTLEDAKRWGDLEYKRLYKEGLLPVWEIGDGV
jgi:hypothetical protein